MVMALHTSCHQASYEEAVLSAIRVGGDTPSRAGLAGALIAAASGVECMPAEWRSLTANNAEVQRLAEQVAAHAGGLAARRIA